MKIMRLSQKAGLMNKFFSGVSSQYTSFFFIYMCFRILDHRFRIRSRAYQFFTVGWAVTREAWAMSVGYTCNSLFGFLTFQPVELCRCVFCKLCNKKSQSDRFLSRPHRHRKNGLIFIMYNVLHCTLPPFPKLVTCLPPGVDIRLYKSLLLYDQSYCTKLLEWTIGSH